MQLDTLCMGPVYHWPSGWSLLSQGFSGEGLLEPADRADRDPDEFGPNCGDLVPGYSHQQRFHVRQPAPKWRDSLFLDLSCAPLGQPILAA
jgi:hypothetical protein